MKAKIKWIVVRILRCILCILTGRRKGGMK